MCIRDSFSEDEDVQGVDPAPVEETGESGGVEFGDLPDRRTAIVLRHLELEPGVLRRNQRLAIVQVVPSRESALPGAYVSGRGNDHESLGDPRPGGRLSGLIDEHRGTHNALS